MKNVMDDFDNIKNANIIENYCNIYNQVLLRELLGVNEEINYVNGVFSCDLNRSFDEMKNDSYKVIAMTMCLAGLVGTILNSHSVILKWDDAELSGYINKLIRLYQDNLIQSLYKSKEYSK